MSYYDRQSSHQPPRRSKTSSPTPNWTTKTLSNTQKAQLSIAARVAWDIQQSAGLADGSFDDWRHTETMVACGVSSLREATNSHYRSILAHFLRLSGKESEADALWAKTGRVAGSAQVGDTHENREVAKALIRDLVAKSKGLIGEAYVLAIVADKYPGKSQQDLTAADLQHLVMTIKARLRKKML